VEVNVDWVTLAVLCFAILVLIFSLWRAGEAGRRIRAISAVARRAESQAELHLVNAGFLIEDRQVSGTLSLRIDGQLVVVDCRADLMVSRGGRTFVAEVKSGPENSDPCRPATRRQLLEYLLAFDVDGVILVDMYRGCWFEVAFPELETLVA
jgi:hypothetical protein